MNKKFLKALALVGCALLLVTASVVGTYAVLTSTATVTNTFTAGKVAITLDEAKVTDYGVADGTSRVTENEYKLIPTHTYMKDPTIHVADGSEDCYLFVKIDNGLASIEIEESNTEHDTIVEQLVANGWTQIGSTGVYFYENIVSENTDVVVFEEFTLRATADVAANKEKKIVVTAYAVQADGFTDASAAWTAASFS